MYDSFLPAAFVKIVVVEKKLDIVVVSENEHVFPVAAFSYDKNHFKRVFKELIHKGHCAVGRGKNDYTVRVAGGDDKDVARRQRAFGRVAYRYRRLERESVYTILKNKKAFEKRVVLIIIYYALQRGDHKGCDRQNALQPIHRRSGQEPSCL